MKKLSTIILTMTAAAAVMLGTATQVYAGHHFNRQQQESSPSIPACPYECGKLPNPSCEVHTTSACSTGHTADCGHQSTASHHAYRHHRSTGHHE